MLKEVQNIRSKITNQVILLGVVFLTPSYIISMARWLEIGWSPIYLVHSLVFFLSVALFLLRKQIAVDVKVYSLIFLYSLLGISALLLFGFSGVHYFVVVAMAIASVLLKRKKAFWIIVAIAVAYIGVGILYVLNILQPQIELNRFSHSVLQWTAIIFSMIAFSAIFIDGFGELYRRLLFVLHEKEIVKEHLEERNAILARAKEELARKLEELKTVNLKLKLSEEKYRSLVKFSPDIVYWYSSQNGGVYFSDSTSDVLGYSPTELASDKQLWLSLIHPADLKDYQAKLEHLALHEKVKLQYRLRTKNQDWLWVNDSLVMIKQTKDERVIQGHLTDISGQKKAEQELLESERRWHFSVDNSELALWDWNMATDKVFYSKQWKNILGIGDEKLNGYQDWEKRIHPEDLPSLMERLENHMKGKKDSFVSEYRMLCNDGSYKWILDRGKILSYGADGMPNRMIGTVSDITPRKIGQIELLKSNAKKDKFFALIAHDLKSPFSSMLGLSGILNDEFDSLDEKTRKKFIAGIHEGISKTYALLEDLLLWSRAQSSTIDFSPQKLNVREIVDGITSMLQLTAENKNIQIDVQVPADAKIVADHFMLSSIVRNLLSNAIKFTPRKGRVVVAFETGIQGSQEVVKISVSDTGVGIPGGDCAQIFDVAKNKSRTGTENEPGTGMGLPICYEFVTRHKGNIWCDSKPGEGTTFYVTLPQ